MFELSFSVLCSDDDHISSCSLEEFERVEKAKKEREAAENEVEALAFDTSLLVEDEAFLVKTKTEEKEKIE